jgi:hypothetical protein
MPSMPPSGMPPPPMGRPPMAGPLDMPAGGAEGMPAPDEIRGTLVRVLLEVKKVAEQNGLDFASLVSEVARSKSAPPPPVARP